MTKKKQITKLTDAQRAAMPAWRDKWIANGLSTAPMTADDRSKVEASIRAMYRFAGLNEPRVVVFVPSPLVLRIASGIAAGVLYARKNPEKVRDAVRGAVDGAVDGAVGGAVGGAVYDAVYGAVRDAVGGAVDGAVYGAVRDAVGGAVDGAVRGAVYDAVDGAVRGAVYGAVGGAVRGAVDGAVRDAVYDAVDGAVDGAVGGAVGGAVRGATKFLLLCADRAWLMQRGGSFWAAFPAYISFLRDVCGLDIPEWNKFGHLETTQSACGPYAVHEDFAMVSDRPEILKRDAAGRLHAEEGYAIRWRDGSGFAFWHGLRLPRDREWIVFDRAKLDPAAIDAETNAEFRRVMLEAYGFERYLSARKAKVIDVDVLHGEKRELLEVNVRDETLLVVRVRNGSLEPDGSRREFVLGAARRSRSGAQPGTAHEAIAASYGINPQHYREAVRT